MAINGEYGESPWSGSVLRCFGTISARIILKGTRAVAFALNPQMKWLIG